MQIRVLIVGDDNKVHPYEFPTYEDAINFLEEKRGGNETESEVTLGITDDASTDPKKNEESSND